MATRSYHSTKAFAFHQQDQQHLLSPSMSSPGFSSGHPSPLQLLQLLTHEQSAQYEDFVDLKEAEVEDAVCFLHMF
jgi:hypothetical protein